MQKYFCNEHSNSEITHFCNSESCLIPLCSICLNKHLFINNSENHNKNIYKINDVKSNCLNELEKLKKNYEIFITEQKMYFHEDLKKNVITKLDFFFQSKNELIFDSEINKIITEINNNYDLINKDCSIDNIKYVLSLNLKAKLLENKEKYKEFLNKYKNNCINIFDNSLSLCFKNKPINNKEDLNKKEIKTIKKTPRNIDESLLYNNSEIKENKNNNFLNFKIEILDKFQPKIKYLHFFQTKSKILHLIEINNKNIRYISHELAISFLIPRWHKSILTSPNEIYLNGGISIENSSIKLSKTYLIKIDNLSIIEMNSMNYARSNHGLIYLNNFIYSIGGILNDGKYTDKCERFDIINKNWKSICPLNHCISNMAICIFNNDSIFVFGGKVDDNFLSKSIEKYNVNIDKWINICYKIEDPPINFRLLASSAAIQINSSQIFIFGGAYKESKKKSDQTFIFEINEIINVMEKDNIYDDKSYIIKLINNKKLVNANGFWNNVPIINDDKIFALQNINAAQDENMIHLDKMKLIVFDGNKWVNLN